MPVEGAVLVIARYHFWSYAICNKPKYYVAGHFEWGYTNRLDLLNAPHVTTTHQDKPQWIPDR